MKFLFVLEFILLINAIQGEPKPNIILIPREHSTGDANPQLPLNNLRQKPIIINGFPDQRLQERPNNVMQTVVNQFKRDMNQKPNYSNAGIPELVITDPDQHLDQQSMRSPPEMMQKIYRLPAMTRMIASEEESVNNLKGNPVWRSPTPVLHHMNCPHLQGMRHSSRRLRTIRRKGHRQRKTLMPMKTQKTTTAKPVADMDTSGGEPLHSLLMSIMSHSMPLPEPESLGSDDNELKPPTAILMSITRRLEPEVPELPFIPSPDNTFNSKIPFLMALMHKRVDSEPEPDFPLPPFNPFLRLLGKIHKPIVPKMDEKESKEENSKGITNFNFNVNLTVNNNNYPKPETRPMGHSFRPVLPFSLLRSL